MSSRLFVMHHSGNKIWSIQYYYSITYYLAREPIPNHFHVYLAILRYIFFHRRFNITYNPQVKRKKNHKIKLLFIIISHISMLFRSFSNVLKCNFSFLKWVFWSDCLCLLEMDFPNSSSCFLKLEYWIFKVSNNISRIKDNWISFIVVIEIYFHFIVLLWAV